MRTVIASWRLLIAEWRFSLLLGLSLTAFMLLALPVRHSLVAFPLSRSEVIGWISDFAMTFVVLDFLMYAPIYVGLAIALVPLHRRILLGEARRFPFRVGRRELSYGAFLILLEVISVILIAALMSFVFPIIYRTRGMGQDGVLPGVAGEIAASAVVFGLVILVVGAFIYVHARLSLALPGMAIGARAAIAGGWRSSRGNGGHLVAVIVLVSLPAGLPMVLLDGMWSGDVDLGLEGPIMLDTETLHEWPAPFMPPSGATALGAVLYTLAVLPGAAALSLAYKRLAGTNVAAGEG